jgi:hypothetical protein
MGCKRKVSAIELQRLGLGLNRKPSAEQESLGCPGMGVGVGIMTAGASCRPQSLRSALAKISAQSRVPNQPFAFSVSTTGQWEECALLISSD